MESCCQCSDVSGQMYLHTRVCHAAMSSEWLRDFDISTGWPTTYPASLQPNTPLARLHSLRRARERDCPPFSSTAWRMAHSKMCLATLMFVAMSLVATCQNTPFFNKIDSPALLEIAPQPRALSGGAWLDVDGDGDLDFVLAGDPDEGVFLQWLENKGADGFAARTLDEDVVNLPGESVRGTVVTKVRLTGPFFIMTTLPDVHAAEL